MLKLFSACVVMYTTRICCIRHCTHIVYNFVVVAE